VQRYFIYLSYNGASYHGWQYQPHSSSVQETIEQALALVLRRDVPIVGAGRTDTGVHAAMMVAHFDCEEPLSNPSALAERLNLVLPQDIAIDRIVPVVSAAHARFSAISRTYKYYVTSRKDPFVGDLRCKIRGSYDFNKMNEAAQYLFEYIDFTSFSRLHTDVKTNNCRIMEAHWSQEHADEWVFTIKADRFLRNMVRAVVGTLLKVGRGKITLEDFRRIIEQKDRCKAGDSAPAQGLFLTHIEYPEYLFM
jgi:pseudouridylate synthase I